MIPNLAEPIAEHIRCAERLAGQVSTIEAVVDRIVKCFASGGRLFVLGNGGSAADAQHIAAELVGRFKLDRSPLPALALTTDSSILSAVANDMGYEFTFARQVDALVREGDVVWGLSVSGTSPNVIRAMRAAKAKGAVLIGFAGRTGGELRPLCDVCLCADHTSSDRVQEMHQLAYHLVCEAVERRFTSPGGRAAGA